MAYLQIYRWEDLTYPEFRLIKLNRDEQTQLLAKLSKHFKVNEPTIKQSHKRGGGTYWHFTEEISTHVVETMDVIIHEFAHHYNWKKYHEHGHRKSFKKCLIRVYKYAERFLPKPLTKTEFLGTL